MPEEDATLKERAWSGELKRNKANEMSFRRAGAGMYQTGKKAQTIGKEAGGWRGRAASWTGKDMEEQGKKLNAVAQLKRDKRLSAAGAGGAAKEKAEDMVVAPMRMGTNRLLRGAWTYFLPSWGATLIWINIHVFLHLIFPKIFGPLGSEWTPKQAAAVTGKEESEKIGKMIGIVEVMGFVLLDLLALAIILGFLALIVMILTWFGQGFWKSLWHIFQAVYNLGWNGVIDLVNLFKNAV